MVSAWAKFDAQQECIRQSNEMKTRAYDETVRRIHDELPQEVLRNSLACVVQRLRHEGQMIVADQPNKSIPQVFESQQNKDREDQHNTGHTYWR